MSNLEQECAVDSATSCEDSARLLIKPRKISLHTRSGTVVNRNLPHRDLRLIGPWCFLDQFGPVETKDAMRVAAHPHTGLQTVTWLIQGSVLHQDSLGTESVIRPGELNLMTSGRGIAHSELSLNKDETIHGIQLWVALPDTSRNTNPSFEHHSTFPTLTTATGMAIKVFAGQYFELKSSAKFFSELVGAEIEISTSKETLNLDTSWEHGLLAVSGDFTVDGVLVKTGELFYLPTGIDSVELSSNEISKLLLIGGQPMKEKIVMWWNFVGRSHEEIVEMREAWESEGPRFPGFTSVIPDRIPAPALPNVRLTAR